MRPLRLVVLVAVMLLVVAAVGSGAVLPAPAVAQGTTTSGLCDSEGIVQFSDVADSDYAAAYILCMRALGLSQGRSDGGYGPDRELNRGQMASFLIRLWTDHLGRQCPSGVVVPFTDTEGTTHEARIECLFALGITQGTSATTYGPQDPLKASQISRFLYRMYEKAGGDQCAGTAGSELVRASECLLSLRVVPSTGEATSATAVIRSQMGVYVIGLWHNLTGKGLPPTPPQLPATTTTTATTVEADVLAEIADAEAYMVELVNELRESVGRAPLRSHPGLAKVARAWSGEMAEGDFVHNPDWRTQFPAGWTAGGENIAHTPGPVDRAAVDTAFSALVHSPGHHRNMISDLFSHIGVGIAYTGAQVYMTQNFACYPPDVETRSCDGQGTDQVAPTRVLPPDPQYTGPGYEDGLPPRGLFPFDATCDGEGSVGTYTDVDMNVYQEDDMYAVGTDGSLRCHAIDRPIPSGGFISVSSGNGRRCAVRTDNTLACWSGLTPLNAPSGEFAAVAAGLDHTCALRVSGSVVCWGLDRFGETDAPAGVFTTVTAGSYHSCGLRAGSTVVCWGFHRYVQSPPGQFTSIDTGTEHSCGVRTDGTVTCWGVLGAGEGDVPAGTFTTVTAGDGISCGIRVDGTIACWGRGWGNDNRFPAIPAGQFTQLSLGVSFDCGLRTDQTIVCWGRGGAVNRDASDFIPVSSLGLTKLSRGASRGSGCGLRADNSAVCWGLTIPRGFGQFGLQVTWYGPFEFFEIPGEYTDIVVTGIDNHILCLLATDGMVSCRGSDYFAQLVDESKTTKFTALVASPGSWSPAACGLRSDGTVTCWGDPRLDVVTDVPDGTFTTIDMGGLLFTTYACAVGTDGSLTCWGDAHEFEDDGGIAIPQPSTGTYIDVSVSGTNACSLRADHHIVCWSWLERTYNDITKQAENWLSISYSGFIVDETMIEDGDLYTDRPNVIRPPEGEFKSVSTGYRSACALRMDGSMECWGDLLPYALDGTFISVEGQCGLQADTSVICRALLLPKGVTWNRHPVHCRTISDTSVSDTATDCVLNLNDNANANVKWIPPIPPHYPTFDVSISYPTSVIVNSRNYPENCWIMIDKWVYDVTPGRGYEYTGPGSILDHCGTDALDHFLSNGIEMPDVKYIRGSRQGWH